jgi:ribosomal protein S12
MAMSSAVLLASENKKLRIENQRQKKKRVKKRTYIARGGVLSGAEGASRAQAAREGVVKRAAEAAAKRPQRAPRKCSICESTEHTARTCPRR